MENNKGFSLVELIIVVAIMAVLMGILAPQYIRYVEKTRIRADDSIISEVDKSCQATLALEKFYTDTSGTVTVIVADDGTVSASGFNTATISAAFEAEVNTSVYGQPSSVNKFKSKGYNGSGKSTTITYSYNSMLSTWQASIVNQIADSKYCP